MTGTQHSSSVHTRFKGVLALVISMMSSPPGMAWNEGVATDDGLTELTRIWCGPSSMANCFVTISRAAFDML